MMTTSSIFTLYVILVVCITKATGNIGTNTALYKSTSTRIPNLNPNTNRNLNKTPSYYDSLMFELSNVQNKINKVRRHLNIN